MTNTDPFESLIEGFFKSYYTSGKKPPIASSNRKPFGGFENDETPVENETPTGSEVPAEGEEQGTAPEADWDPLITVYGDPEAVVPEMTCRLSELIADNPDWEPEEWDEVRNDLATKGKHAGGGGAAAYYEFRLAEDLDEETDESAEADNEAPEESAGESESEGEEAKDEPKDDEESEGEGGDSEEWDFEKKKAQED